MCGCRLAIGEDVICSSCNLDLPRTNFWIKPYDNEYDTGYKDETEDALDEVKAAIKQVMDGAEVIELEPQNTQIRKLQHELVEQYGLQSTSIGEGENRHLRISR